MKPISAIIRKSEKIWNVYTSVVDKFWCALSVVSPVINSKRQFKAAFGKPLNLKNPNTLNEKLMFMKLKKYWHNPLVTKCADKLMVREFVEEKGCGEILLKLYGSWEKASDIDWNSLPEKFAIKCNHGSGYNIICKDKTCFDTIKASNSLDKWLKERYGIQYTEYGIYDNIPRRILAEEFIETADGLPPKDYKFFCSYGKVLFLFVASDRYDSNTKFDYYYPDWTYIPVKNFFDNNGPVRKPDKLEEMIHYAEVLSKEIPMVRVDFYNEGNRIIFGEMTFTHFGCLNRYEPESYDELFGSYFPKASELEKWNNY